MDPSFSKNDLNMFYKYLDKATNYFEYGSGGSTYQASIRVNIKCIVSVESDIVWYNLLSNKITHCNFHFKLIDLKCKPNNLGYPSELCSENDKISYSDAIKNKISKETSNKLDLILIDGRYRVACALKIHSIVNNNCKIIFDDFLNRPHYHIILNYYNIIEKTEDNRMVVLQKKNINVPLELIKKYEKVPS